MDLTVVPPCSFLQKNFFYRFHKGMSADTAGIYCVTFLQTAANPGVLRDVPKGHVNRRIHGLHAMIERSTHNPHECGIAEMLSPLEIERDLSGVIRLMASFAQRNEIIRSIAAGLSALNMVDI